MCDLQEAVHIDELSVATNWFVYGPTLVAIVLQMH